MEDDAIHSGNDGELETGVARDEFRMALLEAHRTRSQVGTLEAAAAQFCQALRRDGTSPERMLIAAKEVIHGAINGDDVLLAERAVLSCIQHYYRE